MIFTYRALNLGSFGSFAARSMMTGFGKSGKSIKDFESKTFTQAAAIASETKV